MQTLCTNKREENFFIFNSSFNSLTYVFHSIKYLLTLCTHQKQLNYHKSGCNGRMMWKCRYKNNGPLLSFTCCHIKRKLHKGKARAKKKKIELRMGKTEGKNGTKVRDDTRKNYTHRMNKRERRKKERKC